MEDWIGITMFAFFLAAVLFFTYVIKSAVVWVIVSAMSAMKNKTKTMTYAIPLNEGGPTMAEMLEFEEVEIETIHYADPIKIANKDRRRFVVISFRTVRELRGRRLPHTYKLGLPLEALVEVKPALRDLLDQIPDHQS